MELVQLSSPSNSDVEEVKKERELTAKFISLLNGKLSSCLQEIKES